MLRYLDHNATTPNAPEVLEAMLPYLGERFGNPSSLHRAGASLRRDLETARAAVARLIGADPIEIIFTSGGTESNNLALAGAWEAAGSNKPGVVTSRVEHPSVLNPCRRLRDAGARLVELAVDREGRLEPAALEDALRSAPGPALVSLMWANNETGVLFPIAALAQAAKAAGAVVHSDAVQAAGKVPVDVRTVPVDLLSLSGHKFQAPKGVGALYVRRRTRLSPILLGGGQEGGLRAGTSNVAFIVGLGTACGLAAERLDDMRTRVADLRDHLQEGLLAGCPGAAANGGAAERLPNTVNLRFPGVEGESLLYRLDQAGIAVSTGSACSSAKSEPSHVLLAMGLSPRDAAGSIRFSLGLDNTTEDVDAVIRRTVEIVASLRSGSRGR